MKDVNKITPRTLSGTMELLPSEQIMFNQMKEKIRLSYEKFGFLPLDTPILELSEVLLAKAGGETEKQIYSFKKGDTDLSLRFDLTVPLAKYVAMNYGQLQFPFRRYQIGKVYRGERPQKGRYREFYQADIDIIGDGELNVINDAEIPSIIYNTFKSLGFDNFTIRINNRKILNGLFRELNLVDKSVEVLRIIDKLDKIGKEKVSSLLIDLGVSEKSVSKIMEFILISGTNDEILASIKSLNIKDEVFLEGLNELEKVVSYINLFGVPEKNYTIDLTIARGLDYYTGTVYETFLDDYKQLGSVCSGGRYDNLAEYYTNKSLPGVGVSIGLTRFFYELNELNAINEYKHSIADVLVVSASNEVSCVLSVATALRNEDINVDVYTSDKKLKAKFKYADKLNIPYVAVIGEDEIKNNTISLKKLSDGTQSCVSLEDAIKILKGE